MVIDTATYKPYADERKVKLEASFELIDVDASILATADGSVGTFFSAIEQTHDKIPYMSRKIATVEPNEWKLDGSYSLIRENKTNSEVGYWSDTVSDEDGNINVSLTYSLPGLSTVISKRILFHWLWGITLFLLT